MQLDPGQLAILGLVASVITQGLRLLSSRFGYDAPRAVVTLAIFVLSIPLSAWFFGLPEVPASGDPMELAQALLAQATVVFGSAVVVYNTLLNRVLQEA